MVTTVSDDAGDLHECDLCLARYASRAAAQECETIDAAEDTR